jgi:hypothetical protein
MRVARSLGPLRDQVVFIGGAIAPLLQLDPPFANPRATSDVDAILATASYSRMHEIQASLRQVGFREDLSDPRHMHRWISPDGVPFDLVPAGQHPGATGSRWDALAIQTAARAALAPDLEIRHATAPAFLALKWAAHDDRGRTDPLTSHDLEDILALLAARPALTSEVAAAPTELREFVRARAGSLLADPDIRFLLAAHLNNARDPAHAMQVVRRALEEIVSPE